MKKFTFMLLAAFIAACAWAQPTAEKNRLQLPEQLAVTAKSYKLVPEKKEMAPRTPLKGKVQAPVKNTNSKKAKSVRKKAFDFSVLLSGEPETFLIKSYSFSMKNVGTTEEPEYDLVPNNIFRVSEFWTITLDATTMEISITGIGEGDLPVKGVVNPQTMEITIPYGQDVKTLTNGTKAMFSATGADNLVCTLGENGIEFGDYWYLAYVGGDNDGYMASDIYLSEAVQPNGKMTFGDDEVVIYIDVDEVNYIATVWNFADEGVAVDVTLKPEGKFIIEPQLIYEGGSTYGDFYTYDSDWKSLISGTGTENTLTFANTWTICAPSTGYWFGEQPAATITFDGTFVYPEIPDTPATPAAPEVTFFDFWNGEYATVTVNVPCVDAEGNDIKGSLLTYQLYTADAEGNAVALGEPIAYDNAENGTGDTKTVKLGEEAKNLTVIAAKSIYTAAGETNESEMSEWYEIPEVVVIPEGLEVKEYPVTADAYSDSWTTYTGTALVGVDGTDVYVQGILPHCPNGWAKGILENGVVTFPVQCVGTYSGVYIYLASYGDGPSPVTFTYIADEDMYQSTDAIIANAYTDKFGFYYPYFSGMTIGTEVIPELVELPVGAEVVKYPFLGTTYSNTGSTEFETTVNVAVVENYVYVQGLNTYDPQAWVKGTKDEESGNIIFPTGQNLGTFEYSGTTYQFYMIGYDGTDIVDVVMTYNEAQDYYMLQNDLIVNGKKRSLSYYKWYEAGSTIGIQKEFDYTFDFNAMDIPTSSNVSTDGDITETLELTEGSVTLAISPKDEGAKTENRFWSTGNGPQLRVYSGTLTFSVPSGYVITQIVFNNGKWNDGNSADSGEFEGATWTGKAQNVVVSIAANTQINNIIVTVTPGVIISDALYATFVAPYDIDFTGSEVNAFAAQASDTYVHLEPVTTVPAGTAVVVSAAEAGTYTLTRTVGVTLGTNNDLVAATEPVVADGTQYILAKEGEEVGFYQVTPETTIAAGKGYLVIEAAVKAFYPLEDGNATGIESLTPALSESEGAIFNLAGQRISKIQKGISIVNGKKILK